MTAPLVARPLVAAIDAAVEQCQQSIVQLMRARAIAVQQYDEADIEIRLADDDECPRCGPACWHDLRDVMAARGEVTP